MPKSNKVQTRATRDSIANRIVIDMIDRAYSKRSWRGTNLAGSLRG